MDNKIKIEKMIANAENELRPEFSRLEKLALFNQEKVLTAFQKNFVALRHFAGSTGYSYEDEGKFVLSKIFRDTFYAEAAIVSPLLASGTHTIATAFFGVLRPSNTLLSITGTPYDTLVPVLSGDGVGSLKEFGIAYKKVDLKNSGEFNFLQIEKELKKKPTAIFIQRTKGYKHRNSLSIAQIEDAIKMIKALSSETIVLVDNCYGEFTEKREPIEAGADLVMGSLIKNPGGGIAPTGGYIAGSSALINLVSSRFTAPGVGFEVGSYQTGYRDFFQGFFLAPHTTLQALKGALLFSVLFSKLGYCTKPSSPSKVNDIICSIEFAEREKLESFCRAVQASSPVDSFAVPTASRMPGYEDKVIMAAGTFVQGSSIELSADAPIRPPYIAFVQGGLSYEHIRIAARNCLAALDTL